MNSKFKVLWGGMILVIVLLLKAAFVIPDNNLHVIACNVGQGDAFLIVRGSTQIIVDGGPSNAVLDCLAGHIPFWDNKIELVILTNPDRDHYFGLIDVVKRYKVDLFVANAIEKQGEDYKALVDEVLAQNIPISNPITNTQMKVDEIVIDFVWPDPRSLGEVNHSGVGVLGAVAPARSVNELSLVFNLKYQEFDALFTGDIVPESLDEVIQTGKISDIELLKVPHHGSKNGLTKELLDYSKPEVAVMSLGKSNNYGHPHKQVLDMLEESSVLVKRTDKDGEVDVQSDGKTWWLR